MNRPRSGESRNDSERDRGTWLTAALREQADKHEPDLGRIDARFERLIADRHEPAAPARHSRRRARLRLIGIPLGVAAAVAAVSVATVVSFGIGGGHNGHLSSQTATPSIGRSSSPQTHRPTSQSTSTPARPAPPATTTTGGHSRPTPPAGPLTASGAVDPHSTQYWAQENVTVVTTRPTRGLHVSVTVSGGSTVRPTGSWTTIAPADVTTTVNRTSSGLTYDIALKPGQTLPAGTYRFGVQFNRPATGHDFTKDTYRVSAFTAGSRSTEAMATGSFREV
ncbi:hypothetical protein [Actinomadura rudentiformis]|uniref:Uncharacterized protein n=1 Tax=Actinomadura rudentiformis TaxID=359158 RepID=A0A6H9YZ79_9ACTN|nr:hypothetical protein [Actinomadura rudentiformis]KAB2347997.1 hypothetical protein F8566_19180 [Actinomadura rudentiformis]